MSVRDSPPSSLQRCLALGIAVTVLSTFTMWSFRPQEPVETTSSAALGRVVGEPGGGDRARAIGEPELPEATNVGDQAAAPTYPEAVLAAPLQPSRQDGESSDEGRQGLVQEESELETESPIRAATSIVDRQAVAARVPSTPTATKVQERANVQVGVITSVAAPTTSAPTPEPTTPTTSPPTTRPAPDTTSPNPSPSVAQQRQPTPPTTSPALPTTTTTLLPPTTTLPPPTTTLPPPTTERPAPPPVNSAVLSTSLDNVAPFQFGQSRDGVLGALESEFGPVRFAHPGNWDDFALVQDPGGSYLRTRSNIGDSSQKQFNITVPEASESYLVYSFFLEPGFDAGSANTLATTHSTGIKLPGLMRGSPAENTGGNHTEGGFSGRLMIRGTRKSDGLNYQPREGLSLAAYVYGQEIADQAINSGFGRDYYFLNGFDADPFQGLSTGLHQGVGDPRIWDLPVGEWVTLVLGYRVDGDDGWFKAWTKTGDGQLRPALHVPEVNWTGGDRTAGPDSLLFQNFWGGKGDVWYPDSTSYIRFKDFNVFHAESAALAHAR